MSTPGAPRTTHQILADMRAVLAAIGALLDQLAANRG